MLSDITYGAFSNMNISIFVSVFFVPKLYEGSVGGPTWLPVNGVGHIIGEELLSLEDPNSMQCAVSRPPLCSWREILYFPRP